ncbi:MAG: EAL domain-containing protein [Gammaproteobacteria bacterium]|nr:EAL domain-containing protein [Gammaproteobacteria bacterium]
MFSNQTNKVNNISRALAAQPSASIGSTVSDVVAQDLVDKMTDGVVVIDRFGIIKEINLAAEFIFGYQSIEIIGCHISTIIPDSIFGQNDNNQLNDIRANVQIENSYPFNQVKDSTAYRKGGAEFSMELTITQLCIGRDDIGSGEYYYTALVRDVTESKVMQELLWLNHEELEQLVEQRTQELVETNNQLKAHICDHERIQGALRASKQRLRTMITNAPVVFYSLDVNGVFTMSEGKGLERLGLKPGGLVGQSAFELFEHIPHFYGDFQKVLNGEKVSPILEINDIVFECWYSVVREKNGEVTGIIGVATDITERKQAENRLVQLANFDSLTGLPNRSLFRDRLMHAVAQAHRKNHLVAVLFLDLDRFKLINDSLGHHAGDELLKAVSKRLLANAREEDTVARLGGDEFTVILEGITNTEDATVVARKILEVMSKPFILDGHEVFVTTSVGITIFPMDGLCIDVLLKNADTAMYRAKEQGRNNYQFYTADMNAKAVEHLILESSLRHALERDEFVLHFQPQVDLHSREITGMEALLRWNNPDLGMLYPNQFMLLAEETGLIISIGEWVLGRACIQAVEWQKMGLPPMRIAVNLSALQFRKNDLVETISNILASAGLDPQYLELEITESFLMDNVDSAIAKLQDLSALGVCLALDDFGTGYSSLSYLKRFPLNTLKIDQSFVKDISTDPGDGAIAEAIVALAQSLHLRVMAEGVETEGQLNFLRTRGCDQVQGFLISHPVPAEDIFPWCIETSNNRFAFEQGQLWPGNQ